MSHKTDIGEDDLAAGEEKLRRRSVLGMCGIEDLPSGNIPQLATPRCRYTAVFLRVIGEKHFSETGQGRINVVP